MNIRRTVNEAAKALEAAGAPEPALDAEFLLANVLSLPRLQLKLEKQRELTAPELARFQQFLDRRLQREPLQYILGDQIFMGLPFRVSPAVLIPRFDTEVICEAVIRRAPRGGRVLDLCTGSGAIAISVKKNRPDLKLYASDLSNEALAIAKGNATLNNTEITFYEGDLWAPLESEAAFDLIVSNPPYIEESTIDTLQKEVLQEPRMALSGGEDGLDFYRRIASKAPKHLVPGGQLILEIGDTQAEAVSSLLTNSFREITVLQDLNPLPRGIAAVLKNDR